jgi:hypothetical protein
VSTDCGGLVAATRENASAIEVVMFQAQRKYNYCLFFKIHFPGSHNKFLISFSIKLNGYKMGFLDTITLSNKTLSILFYVTFFIFIIPAYILSIMIAVKKNEETHKVSLFTGSGDKAIIQSSATEQELYVFKVQNTPVDGSSNFTGSFNG